MSERRMVWIVEMLGEHWSGRKVWMSTVGMALSRYEARQRLAEWKKRNPGRKHRIAIYVPLARRAIEAIIGLQQAKDAGTKLFERERTARQAAERERDAAARELAKEALRHGETASKLVTVGADRDRLREALRAFPTDCDYSRAWDAKDCPGFPAFARCKGCAARAALSTPPPEAPGAKEVPAPTCGECGVTLKPVGRSAWQCPQRCGPPSCCHKCAAYLEECVCAPAPEQAEGEEER